MIKIRLRGPHLANTRRWLNVGAMLCHVVDCGPTYDGHESVEPDGDPAVTQCWVSTSCLIIVAVKLKMIKQDRMIFGDFSVNFLTDFLEILQRQFSIKILTAVTNSQNYFNISKVRPFAM